MFEVGDTVKLKSGGAVMTVCSERYETGNMTFYRVCWFDNTGELRTETLPGGVLVYFGNNSEG